IELGFITNYQEEHLLMDDAYQDKLALAVAKAIGRYFQE
ncbi:MAG: N-acetylmuramoyl-L-alanine amidase, partial [Selenomonadaceae bacterium]|nr:N-acetylmuramoyl-L-alanine amidase [Selenomonadaceae bacterium]